MDTNSSASRATRGSYRSHSLAFKRAVVEESLQPHASVARVARVHDLNANQVFAWRKAYRNGLLGAADSAVALLPVSVEARAPAASEYSSIAGGATRTDDGCLTLTTRQRQLRIEGRVDPMTLRLVLQEWMQ
jgi:transposase